MADNISDSELVYKVSDHRGETQAIALKELLRRMDEQCKAAKLAVQVLESHDVPAPKTIAALKAAWGMK